MWKILRGLFTLIANDQRALSLVHTGVQVEVDKQNVAVDNLSPVLATNCRRRHFIDFDFHASVDDPIGTEMTCVLGRGLDPPQPTGGHRQRCVVNFPSVV